MLDVTTVLASLGSSAFISATVQMIAKYYFDARLERDKAQLLDAVNAQVEPLKASLQWQTDRLRTMFSALQTERLQAIKDLYAKIVTVESLLNTLAVEKMISDESARLFGEAVHVFINYYLPNRIWFPKAVSDQVDDLRSSVFSVAKLVAAASRDVPPTADLRETIKVTRSAAARTLEDISFVSRAARRRRSNDRLSSSGAFCCRPVSGDHSAHGVVMLRAGEVTRCSAVCTTIVWSARQCVANRRQLVV